jgi:uncharacterized membrane protein YkoI
MNKLSKTLISISLFSISFYTFAGDRNDNADLDDIREWDIVKMETCLDAALDTIPGHARKVEMKIEDDDPVYEFDIESSKDNNTYNVECNAEEGFITEIEREVDANDPYFKSKAKVSKKDAEKTALAVHSGTVTSSELEVGFDGSVTYEFDIQTKLCYEVKVDVDAVTGEIEEANIELYEIGSEKE